ncbi:hypothetical protein PFISCL1PPCAC_7364, partial [Pristionchus fissidentatus]
ASLLPHTIDPSLLATDRITIASAQTSTAPTPSRGVQVAQPSTGPTRGVLQQRPTPTSAQQTLLALALSPKP